jgi:ketosteroid isomerase-like protein
LKQENQMPELTRRTVLAGGAAAALTVLGTASIASAAPQVARAAAAAPDPVLDASNATPEVTRLLLSFFRDKVSRNVDRFMAHFSPELVFYTDATAGSQFQTFPSLKAAFAQLMASWPATIQSYPTKILGDTHSAMVLFTDSPQLFGHELRIIAPIDFRDGKIVREVDYWNGRHIGLAAAQGMHAAEGPGPSEYGETAVGEHTSATIQRVAAALAGAMAAGDTATAAALFTTDATFQDLTLQTAVVGQQAITGFLARARDLLPYGLGTSIRHVVGGERGGGYEWKKPGATVDHGVIALELDAQARISGLTTVWDGSLIDNAALTALLIATIEQ